MGMRNSDCLSVRPRNADELVHLFFNKIIFMYMVDENVSFAEGNEQKPG